MKKWLFPFLSQITMLGMVLFVCALAYFLGGSDSGYGGVIIGLFGLVFCLAIILPLLCFSYSRYCLVGEKFPILFTVYHSFILVLPYSILYLIERETIVYTAIFFVWCQIWALTGLVRWKRKKRKR